MKFKKIVSLATSVVLSTSLLVGCSGKNKGNGGNVSNEKGTLKTYIEKIEQMNYQLEQFIKKVVYSF